MANTYIITGTAGFIGFHTAKRLLDRGDRVIGIDNFNAYYDPALKEARNSILETYDAYTIHRADITDKQAIEAIFSSVACDAVCHLAAQAGVRHSIAHPEEYVRINIEGTVNIFEAARKANVPHVVYASTSSVYGTNPVPWSESQSVDQPITVYGASKKACELMAHVYYDMYGITATGLRFFTVYGPWGRPDMALFLFADAVMHNKPINVFNNGNMKRDFTYVDDIVSGVCAALDMPRGCTVYNLGNAKTVELNHFISCIEKELHTTAQKNLMPMQPGDIPESFADITKARTELAYEPCTNVEDGIRNFIAWYRSYYNS